MKRVRRAGLLAGIAMGIVAPMAAPAAAQNECGVPTANRVTCTAAGNPYAGGITYSVPDDLTVATTADARVTNTLRVTSAGGSANVAAAGVNATTAAGATGIVATGAGNVAVTATGVTTAGLNAAGIVATSTGGTVGIASTAVAVGGAGGAGILANGVAGVSIASGTASAVDNSAIYATSRNGPVGIAISGATSAGPVSDAAVFASSGTAVTVSIATGASVSGTNALTLVSATGSTVTNAGTLTGTNGYAVMVNRGAATVTNTGTITGRLNFLGGNSAATNSRFVNSGTFNVTGFSLFGTGAPSFTNSGTVQVLASAPTDGSVAFVGLASFANSGTVSLANGRAGDVLTIPGTFTASGNSALLLDARLGVFTPQADRLVIGGAANGTTTVTINNVNGGAGGLVPGVVVIQAGAGTTASSFQLAASSTGSGFASYSLAFNPADNSVTLVGAPSGAAYRPVRLIEGARNVSNQVTDLWSAHMRSRRDAPGASGRLWGALIGGRQTRDDFEATTVFGQTAVQNLSYHQDYYGAQLGVDFLGVPGIDAFVLGFTAGYAHSTLGFRGAATDAAYDVANVGAYTHFAAGPLFVNLLGRYDRYWIDYRDRGVGFASHVRGYGFAGVAEVGYRGDLGALFVEPIASLGYAGTDLDDFTALGSGFDLRDADNFRGKAGLRIGKAVGRSAAGALTLYAGGNAVKEFGRQDEARFTNNGTTLTLRGRREPLYGEGYVGLSFAGAGRITGFVEGTGTFGGGNSLTGGAGRAGIRFGF